MPLGTVALRLWPPYTNRVVEQAQAARISGNQLARVATMAMVGTRSEMSAMSISMPRSGVSRRRMTTVSSALTVAVQPISSTATTERCPPLKSERSTPLTSVILH